VCIYIYIYAISQYSVDSIVTLYDQITARRYVDRWGNQVHHMIQMLFPNNDALIHTAGTVQSWLEEHEGKLHLPWPAQSPDFNIIEQHWSVLKTRVRNRFPPAKSLKQLEDVLQEEWCKIPLQTVQNLYESIPRIAAVLKTKGGRTPH
jgi:transposase